MCDYRSGKLNSSSLIRFSKCFRFIMLLLLVLFSFSCGEEDIKEVPEHVRPVKMLTLESVSSMIKREFPGKVRAASRVDLAFKKSGPLIELPVDEGQEIEKGELIARIDPRDFNTELLKLKSRIAEANANLKAMKKGARPEDIQVLEAEVSAASARSKNADQQYKRYKELYIQKQVSKAEFDRYKSSRDVSKAQLNTAIQNLAKGKKGARKEDIEAMEASIQGLMAQKKSAEDAISDTYLKAPFSGLIATKYVNNFEEIQAKQPIVSLQDVSSIEILVDVPEVIIASFNNDDNTEVYAEFSANPGKEYPLILKEFSTVADPQTQTYRIVMTMKAPDDINILPGMTANVFGKADTGAGNNPDYFLIPVNSVVTDESGEKFYVWIVDPETMRVGKTEVSVGVVSGISIAVTGGLKSGQVIVTAGVNYLQDGVKVKKLTGKIGG